MLSAWATDDMPLVSQASSKQQGVLNAATIQLATDGLSPQKDSGAKAKAMPGATRTAEVLRAIPVQRLKPCYVLQTHATVAHVKIGPSLLPSRTTSPSNGSIGTGGCVEGSLLVSTSGMSGLRQLGQKRSFRCSISSSGMAGDFLWMHFPIPRRSPATQKVLSGWFRAFMPFNKWRRCCLPSAFLLTVAC